MKKSLFLLSSLFLLVGCTNDTTKRVSFNATGLMINNELILPLNTINTLTMYSEEDLFKHKGAFNSTLNDVSLYLDRYHKYDNLINLKDLNDSCGTDTFVKVDKILFDAIKDGVEMTKLTKGKFNICIGKLVDYYTSFLEDQSLNDIDYDTINGLVDKLPSYNEIDDYIVLDEENLEIKLNKYKNENIIISLGGIGKGFACDKLEDKFKYYNTSYVFNLGQSTIRLNKSNPLNNKGLFKIGFRSPSINPSIVDGTLYLNQSNTTLNFEIWPNNNISTSGDYSNSKLINNHLYHHIIDTRNGLSNNTFRSVSIISSNTPSYCLDALSTAIFNCDSPNEAKELIDIVAKQFNSNIDYLLLTSLKEDGVTNFSKYDVYVSSTYYEQANKQEDSNINKIYML